jgi:hypothetical protein
VQHRCWSLSRSTSLTLCVHVHGVLMRVLKAVPTTIELVLKGFTQHMTVLPMTWISQLSLLFAGCSESCSL